MTKPSDLKIELTSISKLKPFIGNPRVHSERNIADIKRSIERFGWTNPILVRRGDNMIIAGHGRLKAAEAAGMTEVPVIFLDWSENDSKLYSITDNRTAETAEWSNNALRDLIRELDAYPDIDLRDTAFSIDEMDDLMAKDPKLLNQLMAEKEGVPIQFAPEAAESGDIWNLGRHRIVCGDATDAADVAAAVGATEATFCLTDPPYCINYQNQVRKNGEKSRMERGEIFRDSADPHELLNGFIGLLPCDILVMTFPVTMHFSELAEATRDWELLYECVWVKHHFAYVCGRRYMPRHEPILIFRRKKGETGVWNVPENQSTVFEYPKPAVNPSHPTPKPLELWKQLVKYHSNPGQTVYDPFVGSGTTLIACEQLDRTCVGLEIEPKYVDLIIDAYAAIVPEDAEITYIREGETHRHFIKGLQ